MIAPPPSSDTSVPAVRRAEEVAEAMATAWRKGDRDGAEVWLAQNSELLETPAAILRLVWEEICLRDDLGLPVLWDDFISRFPDDLTGLRTVFDCRQLIEWSPLEPSFPVAGDVCCDFELTAELGRGARGRVFRARELSLASRPVVLKFTPRDGGEHLSLARLQHTHIVPLYSAHDLPERGLRLLCMPDLGGSTLDRIADGAAGGAFSGLLGPDGLPDHRAIARIGACLADALDYAHTRGLIHLDVKPSNVLLTAEGVPMLLDFHLARGVVSAGASGNVVTGGTLAYMSPEQRAAWDAVHAGRPVPEAVDGRSDLYSLALTLWQALAVLFGQDPATARHVPPGLRAILDRCTAAAPAARYPTAAELAADLRRHLADLPLKGVRNRSWAERWAKWRRRRPHALVVGAARVAVLAAAVGVGLLGLEESQKAVRKAEAALVEGRQLSQRGDSQGAIRVLTRGLADVDGVPLAGDVRDRLKVELRHTRAVESARRIHELTERLRRHYGGPHETQPGAEDSDAFFRRVWDSKSQLLAELGGEGDATTLRADLLDLAILWSDRRIGTTGSRPDWVALREALDLLNQAEGLFGASQPLCRERQRVAEALGDTALAQAEAARAAMLPTVSAWDHIALGRWLLRRGDLTGAATAFARATALRPGDFWPWFWTGLCAHDRGAFAEAVSAFTACIALAPDRAESYFNRAVARVAAGELGLAQADFNRAVMLDPTLADAVHRATSLTRRGPTPKPTRVMPVPSPPGPIRP